MARKTNKVSTIQTVVDTYASGITRRTDLMARTCKNEGVITETGNALVAHVRASGGARVAYHAKTGQTVLVSPQALWGNVIETIEPGAQKLPPSTGPDYSELEARIAAALKAGQLNAAGELLSNAVTEENKAASTQGKTATQAMIEGTMIHDMVQREMAGKKALLSVLYGRRPNAMIVDESFRIPSFLRYEAPAIEQQTYKSATMGPIKLSKRGKDLLIENRDAIQTAVGRGNYNAAGQVVSVSRGKIAQYISELESKVNELTVKVIDATGATNA